MKKFISALLAAAMAAALSCVFVSAKETNIALHKPWSGIEVPTNEGANAYTGDFTDGVYAAEGDAFSYKEPWFTFSCNDQNDSSWTNLTDRVGRVDIELGDAGTGITKVRMQVAPEIGGAEYIKVYADDKEIGAMTYEGTDIQWIELALDGPIDAETISVEIKITDMFFMVSEIEVIAETADDSSAPEDSSTPPTADAGTAAAVIAGLAALFVSAVLIKKKA